MEIIKTVALFFAIAVAEIVGCYLPYLWLKHERSAWLLVPAAACLAVFAWLLSLPDWIGVAVSLIGMAIIVIGSRKPGRTLAGPPGPMPIAASATAGCTTFNCQVAID